MDDQLADDLVLQRGHQWKIGKMTGYVFLSPMPSYESAENFQNESMGSSYTKRYQKKKKKHTKMRRSAKRAARLKRHMKGTRVLDVGSNVGFFVKSCLDLGLDAVGVEINPALAKVAKQLFPECKFITSSLEKLAETKKFNAIYCSEVVEHVVDPHGFLKKLFDLLEDDGVLYLTTPSSTEYIKNGKVVKDLGAPDHKFYFDFKNIEVALRQAGFRRFKHLSFLKRKGIKLLAFK